MQDKKHSNTPSQIRNIICLIAVAAFAAITAAIQRNDRQTAQTGYGKTDISTQKDSTLSVMPDGTIVINTTEIGSESYGYGGRVPLKVYFSQGRVLRVEALPNAETSNFFKAVENGGLLEAWNGKTPAEALAMQVDGISGATYSSRGVIGNMKAALEYASHHITYDENGGITVSQPVDYAAWAALAVALMAAILPLFVRNRRYRTVQLVLNIAVLGIWSGTFLCHERLLALFSPSPSLPTVTAYIMAVTAFVYPLFGRHNHYCSNVCPLGSLQELASRCSSRKIRLTARTVNALQWVRRALWATLTFLLISGIFSGWTEWELFAAFSPAATAIPVTVAAALFVLLSVFVPRPYCRFVCPTGTLFRAAQGKL